MSNEILVGLLSVADSWAHREQMDVCRCGVTAVDDDLYGVAGEDASVVGLDGERVPCGLNDVF